MIEYSKILKVLFVSRHEYILLPTSYLLDFLLPIHCLPPLLWSHIRHPLPRVQLVLLRDVHVFAIAIPILLVDFGRRLVPVFVLTIIGILRVLLALGGVFITDFMGRLIWSQVNFGLATSLENGAGWAGG